MGQVRAALKRTNQNSRAAEAKLPDLKVAYSRAIASGSQDEIVAAEAAFHAGMRAAEHLRLAREAHLDNLPNEERAEAEAALEHRIQLEKEAAAALEAAKARVKPAQDAFEAAVKDHENAERAFNGAHGSVFGCRHYIEHQLPQFALQRESLDREDVGAAYEAYSQPQEDAA